MLLSTDEFELFLSSQQGQRLTCVYVPLAHWCIQCFQFLSNVKMNRGEKGKRPLRGRGKIRVNQNI